MLRQAATRLGFMIGMFLGPALFALSHAVGLSSLHIAMLTILCAAAMVPGYHVRPLDATKDSEHRASLAAGPCEVAPLLD
jgi:hypothetical protein